MVVTLLATSLNDTGCMTERGRMYDKRKGECITEKSKLINQFNPYPANVENTVSSQ